MFTHCMNVEMTEKNMCLLGLLSQSLSVGPGFVSGGGRQIPGGLVAGGKRIPNDYGVVLAGNVFLVPASAPRLV